MPFPESLLLIRADASTEIGTGHVMRCLALAQAWQAQGGTVTFATLNTLPDALQTRLQNENITLHLMDTEPGSEDDARQTAALAQSLGAAAVVVDGYHFGGEYQRIIKAAGLKLLFIDDNAHADHYYADFVLNQNVYAEESMYANREPYTILLLGTRYALLRREFWQWNARLVGNPKVANKLLVTMGGADPENVTAKVLDALELIDNNRLDVVVIVGGSNPHLPALQRRVAESRHKIKLMQNVQSMPALMLWANAAISAAGTTTWELAFMGVPMALIAAAENQRQNMKKMGEIGAALALGWHADVTAPSIAKAVQRWLLRVAEGILGLVIDDRGGERVVHRLIYAPLRFRRVRADDCRMVWEWANDPVTRAMSFSSAPIPWEAHVEWFYRKLEDEDCRFWIAVDTQGSPVGQVRYELGDEEEGWVVSVSVAPELRGRDYGTAMIVLSLQRMPRDPLMHRLIVVNAYIKPDNLASIRAFEKAGFVDQGMTEVKGSPAKHYVYAEIPPWLTEPKG